MENFQHKPTTDPCPCGSVCCRPVVGIADQRRRKMFGFRSHPAAEWTWKVIWAGCTCRAVRACVRVLAGCRRQRVNKLSTLPTRQTERERKRERKSRRADDWWLRMTDGRHIGTSSFINPPWRSPSHQFIHLPTAHSPTPLQHLIAERGTCIYIFIHHRDVTTVYITKT